MALQTSGPISMSEIIEEVFGSSSGTSTLGSCASVAGISSPTSMSDFYGYSSSTSGLVQLRLHISSQALACASTGTLLNYYHDGDNYFPAQFDRLYTDAANTTAAIAGYYSNGSNVYRVFGSSGSIISAGSCI